MQYKYISIKQIRTLAKLCNKFIPKHSKKRGRPPKYSEEYIILLFFMRVIRGLSFRSLKIEAKELLKFPSPALSTLHYRFKQLDKRYLEKLFRKIAILIHERLNKAHEYLLCDGTGFGYRDKISLNYKRGKEKRPIYAHVKTELLAVSTIKGIYVIGMSTGPSYSDERKLLKNILRQLPKIKCKYLIADALYGMDTELLKKFIELKHNPIIPVKEGVHTRIRDPIRKIVSENYKRLRQIYKKRYLIEQLIAKIKNSYGDKSSAKTFEMASKEVIAKIIAFNYCFLCNILLLFVRIY